MLTATIQNKHIDLPLDFSFDMVRQSQLLSFDKLRGDYCPSISFPETERNRALMNHPNRFELKRTGVREYPEFELRYNGWLIIAGTLVLQDGYAGFVRGNIGNIAADNADKFISDYELPSNVVVDNKTSYIPGTDEYTLATMTNKNFFKDITNILASGRGTNNELSMLQYYHHKIEFRINQKDGTGVIVYNIDLPMDYDSPSTLTTTKTNVVTPFLYLSTAIKMLFMRNGYKINSVPTELLNLIIYNNVNIVTLKPADAERVLDVDGDGTGRRERVETYLTITQELSTFNYNSLLPVNTSFRDFVLGFQNMLNYCIVLEKNNSAKIINRETIITGESDNLDDYFVSDNWILLEKKDVVLEFEMRHDFGDSFFGDGFQDLSEREDDFETEVSSLDELHAIENPTLGELRRVLDINSIYEYKSDIIVEENGLESEVIGWFFVSIDFQNYKYNKEAGKDKDVEKIQTDFSTVSNTEEAEVLQFGRCSLRKNSEAEFTPRLLFDVNGTAKNNNGTLLLNWRGDNGLIAQRWKYFAEFWAHRQPVTGYFRFPSHVLHNFDINKKKRTRHGEFIISKMTTRITHAGIGETKVEGFKVD